MLKIIILMKIIKKIVKIKVIIKKKGMKRC
jgi:hypothetical protein